MNWKIWKMKIYLKGNFNDKTAPPAVKMKNQTLERCKKQKQKRQIYKMM